MTVVPNTLVTVLSKLLETQVGNDNCYLTIYIAIHNICKLLKKGSAWISSHQIKKSKGSSTLTGAKIFNTFSNIYLSSPFDHFLHPNI